MDGAKLEIMTLDGRLDRRTDADGRKGGREGAAERGRKDDCNLSDEDERERESV